MNEEILNKCLNFFPLRISITDHCNLNCFFCSNEGMPLCCKNTQNINLNSLKFLIKTLAERELKNISITGGEPTLYPKFNELVDFLDKFSFESLFLHTNGINLNNILIKKLAKKFTKIAVSLHSVDFENWQRITHGTKEQFNKILHNLEILSEYNKKNFIVELKYVPIKGFNDSKNNFKNFLKLCNKFQFRFKFLNFEPITHNQIKLAIPVDDIKKSLISIECLRLKKENKFRGQSKYLPIEKFTYKNISGVVIEIGCGNPIACKECYKSNEIFITPELKIKPCHVDNYTIDLKEFIKKKEGRAILEAVINSRLFLSKSPGIGFETWNE
jgi:GTP 3',8-cyclase